MFAAIPAVAQAKGTIAISGSTSVFPLETKLAKAFIKTKKGKKAAFRILQGGSNVGVSDVAKGRVTIGASSRDPALSDPGGLVFTKVARDAICVVTNPANSLTNISLGTLQNIFLPNGTSVPPTTVKATAWSSVPGATVGGTIDPIGRAVTSGTHDAFSKLLLGGKVQDPTVAALSSNGLVQQRVKSDTQGIGYVSLPFTQGLNTVGLNGVPCTLVNAKSGAYLGVRSFYFVTQGAPVGLARKFIAYATSKKGQKIASQDYIPIR